MATGFMHSILLTDAEKDAIISILQLGIDVWEALNKPNNEQKKTMEKLMRKINNC